MKSPSSDESAVEEVCRHEQFKGDLGGDGELGDLRRAVGVANLVSKVHADFLKNVRRNLPEIDFVSFVLCKLSWSRQHGLDGPGGKRIVPLNDKLVTVAADQFHIHSIWPLTAAEGGISRSIHIIISHSL